MKKKQEERAEEVVTVKRKRMYAVLVAACALILAAAVVLTIAFTVGGNDPINDPVIETPDDGNNGEEPEEPSGGDDDEDDEPTAGETVLSLPVANVSVGTSYEFWYNSTLNRYSLHTGVDFSAAAGTSVTAAAAGTIESITDNILEGGKIVIDHGDGLKTVYASIEVNAQLREGDTVAKGDALGTVSAEVDTMGNEYNEGAHLHFEVTQDGESIDPVTYLDLSDK